MLIITLPDKTKRQFDRPLSVYEVAASISPGLAKAAIAGRVNETLVDTSYLIKEDSRVSIITEKDSEALDIIRHSAAHVLAQAVKQIYPSAQITIGPVIEDGFYYDVYYPTGFTPDDLEGLESQMQTIIKQNLTVERREVSRDEAIALFASMGEHYKVKIIQAIDNDQVITLYQQGDFVDLCRGPHVPSTGFIKAFKLMRLSGAYWLGDANNEMLQRIYGTAWLDKKSLKAYLHRLEEAKRRDHRKLGAKLDLFHLSPQAPGMVFWHPKGWTLYRQIERYIEARYDEYGYQQVRTPQLIDRQLLEKSGHWGKFGDGGIFTTGHHPDKGHNEMAIRPMSCPCHVEVYKRRVTSYRDLPLRIAEFGSCHRNEPSGTLHGLMRARHFVQDDGHIFCTEEQIQSEVSACIKQIFQIYHHFGFDRVEIKLSTRPDERIGSDALWDKAESALEQALSSADLEWSLLAGEGAFYGPKIEFSLRDTLGRVWQCGTIQLDFYVPGRLDAYYIDEAGSKQTPVMLHRAALGSMERFIGILLEQYDGKLPLWLAPVQVVVMNIAEKQTDYVKEAVQSLKAQGIRAVEDLRNEKISFKIREHAIQRVPYLLIAGDRELASACFALRNQAGENKGTVTLGDFVKQLTTELAEQGTPLSEELA